MIFYLFMGKQKMINFFDSSHKKFYKMNDQCVSKEHILTGSGGSTCKPGWSQDHLNLQKNVYIHLPKKYYMLN